MKNLFRFFLGYLCLSTTVFSQGIDNIQQQIPIPNLIDKSQSYQTSTNPADYTFQELANTTQGVIINLPQATPPVLREIHLQSGNSQIRFSAFWDDSDKSNRAENGINTNTNGDGFTSIEVNYDASGFVSVFSSTGSNIDTLSGWITPPTSFQTVGEHSMVVQYIDGQGIAETREYQVFVSPAADGFFRDGNVTAFVSGNTLTRYSNPTCNDTRPLLVVEGYDSGNARYAEFYRQRGDYMCTELFGLGYDVYVLNFGLNAQSIEINASVVEAAVSFLSSQYDNEPVALLGVSMGGIVSRLAATRSEDAGAIIPISMLITMDSPHQGAVIDSDLQNWMNLALPFDALRNLGNEASLEMLKFSVMDNGQNRHQTFYTYLESLNGGIGYPIEVPMFATAFSFDDPNPNTGNN